MMNTLDTNIDLRSYLSEAVKTRERKGSSGKQYVGEVDTKEDLLDLLIELGFKEWPYLKKDIPESYSGFCTYMNVKGYLTIQIQQVGRDYCYYMWAERDGKLRRYCMRSNSSDKVPVEEVIIEITRI